MNRLQNKTKLLMVSVLLLIIVLGYNYYEEKKIKERSLDRECPVLVFKK